MSIYGYVGIVYCTIINIISLIIYVKEGKTPSRRLSALWLILLPIVGGSLGACIGNYFSDTEYKELRSWLHKFLAFIPPVLFILHSILLITIIGPETFCTIVWNYVITKTGWIGGCLLIINTISFILIIVRKASYYFAPIGNSLIPDLILIPILIFGGTTGGVIAKILFNFKEDWSCNSTMKVQNFIYNSGMFVLFAIHIGLYIYFFYIK